MFKLLIFYDYAAIVYHDIFLIRRLKYNMSTER